MRVLHSDSSLAVDAGEEEVLEFLSQPVIFSLSINNRTTVLDNASQPVRISFHHKEVSFTQNPGLKRRFFTQKHSLTFHDGNGKPVEVTVMTRSREKGSLSGLVGGN